MKVGQPIRQPSRTPFREMRIVVTVLMEGSRQILETQRRSIATELGGKLHRGGEGEEWRYRILEEKRASCWEGSSCCIGVAFETFRLGCPRHS